MDFEQVFIECKFNDIRIFLTGWFSNCASCFGFAMIFSIA